MNCEVVTDYELDLFRNIQRMFVCGSSGSGKTTLITRLIKRYGSNFDSIVMCGVDTHPLQSDKDISPKLHLSPHIVDPREYKTHENQHVLLIIDDLYAEAGDNPLVRDLYTKGRHDKISVIMVCQNMFYKGKYTRDLSLNVTCFILLRQRDLVQIEVLGRQNFGKRAKEFVEIYEKACSESQYGYLLVDLGLNTRKSLTLRTNCLGEGRHELVYQFNKSAG